MGGYRLTLPAGITGPHVVLFFISSRTGQQVKRAAVGAEGFVLDHFSMEAIQNHIQHVADPLIAACGPNVPYSVFSDSLEVYESDWTPKLLDEFRARRGYDLTPHLPELAAGTTPEAADVRYDWGRTLAELIDEHYLTPLNTWAREHHTKFRSQSYGSPAVTLSSNALVDLPEGEGSQWHSGFSFTRWATSASHVYGRPVTSSETWTWLHSPSFRATPLDMKAEADTFFLQGINQFVGHGWPYSPPSVGDPGWSFYAAAVFNDHNPWWMVMPDVMGYFYAHELPAAPGLAGQRRCRAAAGRRRAGAVQAGARFGHRRDAHAARARIWFRRFSTRATISTSSIRRRSTKLACSTIRCW